MASTGFLAVGSGLGGWSDVQILVSPCATLNEAVYVDFRTLWCFHALEILTSKTVKSRAEYSNRHVGIAFFRTGEGAVAAKPTTDPLIAHPMDETRAMFPGDGKSTSGIRTSAAERLTIRSRRAPRARSPQPPDLYVG